MSLGREQERYQRAVAIFHTATERLSDERSAYIADACAGDAGLLLQVQDLLAGDRAALDLTAAVSRAARDTERDMGESVDDHAALRDDESSSTPFRLVAGIRVGARLGEFRLLREIGRGAMGIVFEAEHEPLARRVALKILAPTLLPDATRLLRFQREARAVARLHHPGIVPVYSTGFKDGLLYFTMELVDGQSLDRLVENAPLEPRHAAHIAARIARALAHAHDNGLVHRDVKPANILIAADGLPRLVDFGLVSELGADSITITHGVVGTPAFMAPEQARGEGVGPASDIYSLGAVLYFMLSGRHPYAGPGATPVLARLLTELPVPLSTVTKGVPVGLLAICERALARTPAARPSSASELADQLERFLAGATSPIDSAGRNKLQLRWLPWLGATLLLAALLLAGLASVLSRGGDSSSALPHAKEAVVLADPLPTGEAMRFEGASARVVTLPGPIRRPALSPDGDWLAYDRVATKANDLYLYRFSDAVVELAVADAMQPLFAADGDRLAFHAQAGGGLSIFDLRRREVKRLGVAGYPVWWSHDGTTIGCASYPPDLLHHTFNLGSQEVTLSLVHAATGVVESLEGLTCGGFAWSPDGAWVAFLHGERDARDIWLRPIRGGPATRLTERPARRWNLTWSPDGRQLYFDTVVEQRLVMRRLAVAPGVAADELPVGLSVLGADAYLAFSGDSRRAVLASAQGLDGLVRLAVDPVSGEVVGLRNFFERLFHLHDPRPSPDGRRLVYANAKTGGLELSAIDGTDMVHIGGEGDHAAPSWSPDGSRIAFHSSRGGHADIWSVAVDGTDLVRHTDTLGSRAVAPVWSPDGARIAFHVEGSGARAIAAREPAPAPGAPLPPFEGGSAFRPSSWSTDGAQLAGWAGGVVIFDLVAGRYERLTSHGQRPVWWGADRLLYVDAGALHVIDRNGRGRPIFHGSPYHLAADLAVSTDGREIYATLSTSMNEIVVFERQPPLLQPSE